MSDRLIGKLSDDGKHLIGRLSMPEATSGTKMWFGTRAEYNELPVIYPDVCYCIEEGT